MSIEIERKFLLKSDEWKKLSEAVLIQQGYLSLVKERLIRVRIVEKKAYLTIKGVVKGISRLEYEYEIPYTDAQEMLDQLCEKPIIEKHRYKIEHKGFVWEVDEFLGQNQGLIIAEIELEFEEQQFDLPEWIGDEISGEEKYYNLYLTKNPYTTWK